MNHNTLIWFTTDTNRAFQHKIVSNNNDNDWIGITFRQSKCFSPSLHMASNHERVELFRLRNRENKTSDPIPYNDISFTISPGDIQTLKEWN